jgi:hypothetical protein
MGMFVYHRAMAVQAQVTTLRLFQGIEYQYQHIGTELFEVLRRMIRTGGNGDVVEFVLQQFFTSSTSVRTSLAMRILAAVGFGVVMLPPASAPARP